MKRQKLTKEQKKNQRQFEILALFKKTRTQILLRFVLSFIITGICLFLGWLLTDKFGASIVKKMEDSTSGMFTWLTSALILILLFQFLLTFFGLRWRNNMDSIKSSVWISIFTILIVLLSPFTLYFVYDIIKTFNIATINIKDYWMLYVVPCLTYAVAAISYGLLIIGRKGTLTWKVQLATGIGSAVSFILTLVMMFVFFAQNNWNGKATGSLLHILCVIASLITSGSLFSSMRAFTNYTMPNKAVITQSIWISGSVIGSITTFVGLIGGIILMSFLFVAGNVVNMGNSIKIPSCQGAVDRMKEPEEVTATVNDAAGNPIKTIRGKKGDIVTGPDGNNLAL